MTCAYCGGEADTIDHVYPRAMGGTDHPSNLVPACGSCNSRKWIYPPELQPLTAVSARKYLTERGWISNSGTAGATSSWSPPGTYPWAHFYTRAAAILHAAYGDKASDPTLRAKP
jgi:hypothetical protein